MDLKINFCIKFCSRYIYPEVCVTKNHEKTICAAETWPLRAPSARTLVYMSKGEVTSISRIIFHDKESYQKRTMRAAAAAAAAKAAAAASASE